MIKQKKIISMMSVIRKSKLIIIFHGDKVIQVYRLDIYIYIPIITFFEVSVRQRMIECL